MHFQQTYADDFGSSNTTKCDGPQQYMWVFQNFGQCIHTDIDFMGFALGMLSNLCWLAAQGPQLWKNYKNGEAESLSILFLAEWLTGDITNLIGCILLIKSTTVTQLTTAVYFCIIDTMMVTQWLYYHNKNKKKKSKFRVQLNSLLLPIVAVGTPMAMLGMFAGSEHSQHRDSNSNHDHGGGRVLLGQRVDASTDILVGYILSWVCAMLYFTSRIPQIVANFRRKTCEGLSPVMFAMAVCGNLFYAAGALTNGGTELDIFYIRLPFLVGSVGTLVFDFTILMQYCCYSKPKSNAYEDDGDDPLLHDGGQYSNHNLGQF